jgi:hypothetical protein
MMMQTLVFCSRCPLAGCRWLMPCAVMAIPNSYVLFSFGTVSGLVSPWLWMIVVVKRAVTLRQTSECVLILCFLFCVYR